MSLIDYRINQSNPSNGYQWNNKQSLLTK